MSLTRPIITLYNDDESLVADLSNGVWRVTQEWLPSSDSPEEMPLYAKPSPTYQDAYTQELVEAKDVIVELLYQAQQWADKKQQNRVWLKWQAHGSYAQRFLVLGGSFTISHGNSVNDPQLQIGTGSTALLRLERAERWYDPTARNVLTDGLQTNPSYAGPVGIPMFNHADPEYVEDISIKGGMTPIDPTTGTADSLPKMTLKWQANGATSANHETWIGIHPHGDYGRDDLQGFWKLTDTGTPATDTQLIDSADIYFRTSYTSTNTLKAVCSGVSPMNNVIGDIRHSYGTHLLLLRYRTIVAPADANDMFGVVVSYGSGHTLTLDEVFLPPSPEWRLAPVGVVTLPSTLTRQPQAYGFNVLFNLSSELINKTGRTDSQLETDGFIPLPADNHLYLQGTAGVNENTLAHIEAYPNGELTAIEYNGSSASYIDLHPEGDLKIPIHGGKLILASNSDTGGNGDGYTATLSVQAFDCWHTWRGRNV